jgi:peptide-methionine (R)-S-oxide reductase
MLLVKDKIMTKLIILLFSFSIVLNACSGQKQKQSENNAALTSLNNDTTKTINRSEAEWKKILTPQQFEVLRQKGTDAPYTGKYYTTTDEGVYHCAACGAQLFTSDMKFESSCGWPSFDQAMEGGTIKTQIDRSHGMIRTEILCGKCGGHLGHLFDDGPTKTGLRYCVNSTSLNFVKASK